MAWSSLLFLITRPGQVYNIYTTNFPFKITSVRFLKSSLVSLLLQARRPSILNLGLVSSQSELTKPKLKIRPNFAHRSVFVMKWTSSKSSFTFRGCTNTCTRRYTNKASLTFLCLIFGVFVPWGFSIHFSHIHTI